MNNPSRETILENALKDAFESLSHVAKSLKGIFDVYHHDEWDQLEDEVKDGIVVDDAMAKIAAIIPVQYEPLFTQQDRDFIALIVWPDDSWMDEDYDPNDDEWGEDEADLFLR